MSRFSLVLAQLAAVPVVVYLGVVILMAAGQRKLLFFPTHGAAATRLEAWTDGNALVGYCRRVGHPENVWLMLHGNGGQAAQRDYVLRCLSGGDSLFVLEYPGYGGRGGEISQASFDRAAAEGFDCLRREFPGTPICVIGESLGSGPACYLASRRDAPAKLVLIVPFDTLADVAAEKLPYLPVRLILRDRWDNVRSLEHYRGKVEIFGAIDDGVIPFIHAKRLAERVPGSVLHTIAGGHNEWAAGGEVVIRN